MSDDPPKFYKPKAEFNYKLFALRLACFIASIIIFDEAINYYFATFGRRFEKPGAWLGILLILILIPTFFQKPRMLLKDILMKKD